MKFGHIYINDTYKDHKYWVTQNRNSINGYVENIENHNENFCSTVHGGITYFGYMKENNRITRQGEKPPKNSIKVLGFDTDHYYDKPNPCDEAKEYLEKYQNDPVYRFITEQNMDLQEFEWTPEKVKKECFTLIDEMIENK